MSYAVSKESLPKYIPSEDEIAAACREIQREWSDVEEQSRRPKPEYWTLQEFECSALSQR